MFSRDWYLNFREPWLIARSLRDAGLGIIEISRTWGYFSGYLGNFILGGLWKIA